MKISKRMKLAVIAFLIVFFLLLLRLAEIQLFFTESFSKKKINLIQESVKQRTEEVLISDGRGSFLDRNGRALTGQSEPAVVLFPFLLTQDWPIKKVADILGMSEDDLRQTLGQAKKPVILQQKKIKTLSKQSITKINSLKYPGIYGVYMENEDKPSLASHTIGSTNQDPALLRKKYPDKESLPITTEIGTTGLERTFDEFCFRDKTQSFYIMWMEKETLCLAWTSNIQLKPIHFIRSRSKQRSIKAFKKQWRRYWMNRG